MNVEVALTHAELVELLQAAAPVRIHLAEGDRDESYVELERPSHVAMVPGQGVRVITSGRVRHELAGIGLPFEVRRVQLLFCPRIVEGSHGHRLDFGLQVEDGDLANVPGLLEAMLSSRVNRALEPERLGTYWELGKALSSSLPLPKRFEPLDRFLAAARTAQLSVTQDAIVMRLDLAFEITRSAPRPRDAV